MGKAIIKGVFPEGGTKSGKALFSGGVVRPSGFPAPSQPGDRGRAGLVP